MSATRIRAMSIWDPPPRHSKRLCRPCGAFAARVHEGGVAVDEWRGAGDEPECRDFVRNGNAGKVASDEWRCGEGALAAVGFEKAKREA
jgi:hypothetical protein